MSPPQIEFPYSLLVAQTVENPSALQETWVGSLGQEDSLEKGMTTPSSILAWNPMDIGAWQATVGGVAKRLTTEQLTLSLFKIEFLY